MFPGPDTRRRLEDQSCEPSFDRLETRGSSRGWDPSCSVVVWCSLAQDLDLRSGGDEETRTPDLLLAKEMLCQLSYVPIVHRKDGGRFWTRTRDLCLIRAVL